MNQNIRVPTGKYFVKAKKKCKYKFEIKRQKTKKSDLLTFG